MPLHRLALTIPLHDRFHLVTRLPQLAEKPACMGRSRVHRPGLELGSQARIAVAVHDIEPATFERCVLIRDWLDDHGVDRVTLLVIPARDLHPLGERSPQMASWLAERRLAGDSIAQHGFQHEQLRRAGRARGLLLRSSERHAAEFVGLNAQETRRALDAGWRVLKLAGLEPDGFVAPASALCGGTLRLDLHPSDLRSTREVRALEWVFGRAGQRRQAITYDALMDAGADDDARARRAGAQRGL